MCGIVTWFTVWVVLAIKHDLEHGVVRSSAVMHLAHIHDDVVDSQLSDKVLINTRKVNIFSSMYDALRCYVGLTDAFEIPINDLVVYPAIKIAGVDALDDLARWREFLTSFLKKQTKAENELTHFRFGHADAV